MAQVVISNQTPQTWSPDAGNGDYHIVIGAGASDDFDSESVEVKQQNVAFTDLDAVTAATRKIVNLVGGADVTFTASGGGGSPTITIEINKVES